MRTFDRNGYIPKDHLLNESNVFDTEETIEARAHDQQWGRHLFELHTHNGTIPVSPELAKTLSYRDLECIMLYPTPEEFDFLRNDVVAKPISVCANELNNRDHQTEAANAN